MKIDRLIERVDICSGDRGRLQFRDGGSVGP